MGLFSEPSQQTVGSLGPIDFMAREQEQTEIREDNPMRGKTSFHLAVTRAKRDSIPEIEINGI